MFTGIIEETGRFAGWNGDTITIEASTILEGVAMGESISVDGCCLTVVEFDESKWKADISDESRKRTTLNYRVAGDVVNLERAARLSDRMGGHLVQGHVDAVGEVLEPGANMRVRMPKELLRYTVEKGSITVDGVSLTIVNLYEDGFDVALIPHTLEVTNLGVKRPGDMVNIEVDVMAKYAERLFSHLPTFNEL